MSFLSAIASGRTAPAAIVLGFFLLSVASAAARPERVGAAARAVRSHAALVQAGEDSDEVEVAPAEVEKYVAVYKAMQRDRSLSVDAAAAQQGLTVQAFRDLESRIQRDDAALQRARDELQAAALQAGPSHHPPSPTPQR